LGKLITNKPVHVNSIQMRLDNIWGSPSGFKVQKIEGKILKGGKETELSQSKTSMALLILTLKTLRGLSHSIFRSSSLANTHKTLLRLWRWSRAELMLT
jgi:hypothetical protein